MRPPVMQRGYDMRIMIVSDGSDDGLDALEKVASLRGGAGDDALVTLVVGWPPRESPMWEIVGERRIIDDDLHRALAETVASVTQRLRGIAGKLAREVASQVQDGDAVEQLVQAVMREQIDVLIAGITGKPSRRHGQDVMNRLLERVAIPIVTVYGTAR
jgi:hypothetical protein